MVEEATTYLGENYLLNLPEQNLTNISNCEIEPVYFTGSDENFSDQDSFYRQVRKLQFKFKKWRGIAVSKMACDPEDLGSHPRLTKVRNDAIFW